MSCYDRGGIDESLLFFFLLLVLLFCKPGSLWMRGFVRTYMLLTAPASGHGRVGRTAASDISGISFR